MKITFISSFFLLFLSSFLNQQNNVRIDTGYAEVNGTKLYYEVAGKGEPIILVHGNFGDRRHWDYQFRGLATKFKTVRYDVRGYGKSAMPDTGQIYYDTKDLKELLEYLKIPKAHLCGVSMGSGIIVDFALEYPEMCLSIIPAGPWANGFGANDYKASAGDSLFAVMWKTGRLAKTKGSKAATDYFWTGNNVMRTTANRSVSTLDSLLKMGYEYSFWGFLNKNKRSYVSPPAIGRLSEIKIPALIITAEYDVPACKEIADIMEKDINGSVKVSIKEAGHLMNMDKPLEFNNLITKFIDGLKRDSNL